MGGISSDGPPCTTAGKCKPLRRGNNTKWIGSRRRISKCSYFRLVLICIIALILIRCIHVSIILALIRIRFPVLILTLIIILFVILCLSTVGGGRWD